MMNLLNWLKLSAKVYLFAISVKIFFHSFVRMTFFIWLKVPKHLFCHKVWPRRLCEVNDSDYNIKQNTECLIDGFVMIMRTLVGGGLMLILSPTPSRNNLENANTTELWRSDPGAQIVKLWKLRLQRPGIYEHLIIVWRHKALLIAIILWKSSGHIYRSRIPSYKTYFHIFYAGFVEAKNVNYNLVIYNYKESLNSSAQCTR